MNKIIKVILFVIMLPLAWLVVRYADEYLQPYHKIELRRMPWTIKDKIK